MTLYEMLDAAMADQEIWIFEHNIFDQNMPLFKGIVEEARVDSSLTVWMYLMSPVVFYDCSHNILDIRIKDEYFDQKLEGHYPYSTKWGKSKDKRPWRYSIEITEEKEKIGSNDTDRR